jgi:chaperonin GroEL
LDSREVWNRLTDGVHAVAKVVAKTYGPNGGKVAVAKSGTVLVTTDGAALTRESQLGGSKRLGAKLVRSAAIRTEEQVGDGTSTTVLLTSALLKEIGKLAASPDWNPVALVAELTEAEREAEETLRGFSEPATETLLRRVASMASHEDPLVADKVVEAILSVGEAGSIVITPYEGTGIELEQKEGLQLAQGWASHEMCPSGASEREMDGPLVAVFRQPVRRVSDVSAAMEAATQWPGRGLVLFAPSVSGDALAALVLNDKKKTLSSVAVQFTGSPADRDDWIEDIATVTNATVVDAAAGFDREKFEGSWLGYARKIAITREKTLIVSYMDEEILSKIDLRAAALKARSVASPYPYERDRLSERASALDGGLATLRVGGLTRPEATDRRSRLEDALLASQTALRGGVVAGAGRAYFGAAILLPETDGGKILSKALRSITRTLLERSERKPSSILEVLGELVREDPSGRFGFDPRAGIYRDFWEDPQVVDPTEVSVVAMRNAVSVASQIALTGGITRKFELRHS